MSKQVTSMRTWLRALLYASLLVTVFCSGVPAPARATSAANDWPMFGQDYNNTAGGSAKTPLHSHNVRLLQPKWVFTTGGDVSARPAVVDGAVYFPDWGGNFFKLDASTGQQIWAHTIASYTGDSGKEVSRTSPAVAGTTVYIGTQTTPN